MKKKCKKLAFTLAEVLITLGIIGVVAALTIPTLLSNSQDKEFKTAYKKAYAQASQVINYCKMNSLFESPTSDSDMIWQSNFQVFMDQFKVIETCLSKNNTKCWDNSGEKLTFVTPAASAPSFVAADSMAWSMRCDNSTGGSCDNSFLLVDTNGFKSPNKFGKDRFSFRLTPSTPVYPSIPDKLYVYPSLKDFDEGTDINGYACPTGPCYYKSWLIGE